MNAAWMDSSVRRFQAAHINVMLGLGEEIQAPVLRDVHAMGLKEIAQQVRQLLLCVYLCVSVSHPVTADSCCCS